MPVGTMPACNRALTGPTTQESYMDTFTRFLCHGTVAGALAAVATFVGVVS